MADFHIAILRRDSPDLGDCPLLIGGDPAKRGKVVAVSEDLRLRGIIEGMGLVEAQGRAPEAKWFRTDLQRAREISGLLRAAIRQEVEAVEIDGLSGFFFRAPTQFDRALQLAQRLEARVADQMGLPLRIGVAPVRFAARMAAEDVGRSGSRVIGGDEFEGYLLSQSVERLPGLGPKTASRLAELGVTGIPGLRELGLERLEVLLGAHGRALWLLACGEDPQLLRVRRHPTTLSREETLAQPEPADLDSESGPTRLTQCLTRISGRLEQALRRDGLRARRIALRLTYADERTVTRSCSLDTPTGDASRLMDVAQDLLARVVVEGGLVRRAGLVLKGLEISGAEERQLDLF